MRARASALMVMTLLASSIGCAPSVDGPVDRQRAIDHEDGTRMAVQLGSLPGAIAANVILHRSVRDPLAAVEPSPPSAAALVIIDDRADRDAIVRSATALVRATAPEIASPVILVELGAIRPRLANVGPFTVEAGSRAPLQIMLVVALVLIVTLAGWIAVHQRRQRTDYRLGNNAQ